MTAFVSRLADVVRAYGDRTAIEDGEGRLTYRQLDRRARAIAGALRARDIGPERVVALEIAKSRAYVEALLGVWYAGGAFTVADPSLPPARRDFIAHASHAALVLDAHAAREAAQHAPVAEPHAARPGELAYVLFTSGSSGAPKGVLIEHQGLVNVLGAQVRAFGLGPESRVLFFLSTSFDASLSDLGTALLAGATLVLDDRADVAAVLRDRRITHADLPPALVHVMSSKDAPALSTLIVGGEASDPATLRSWARAVRVLNVYGPTEATICTSLCVVDAAWDAPLLGEPLPGVTYHVEDGELLIGGVQVARGYTAGGDAARFVTRGGARFFRTGDRVDVRSDGQLVFAGRVDRQVKLRGKLVAPEEIEACLREAPAVAAAAVVLRGLAAGAASSERRGLVAYVEAAQGASPTPRALAEHVAERLPRWMAPSRYVIAPLPRNAAGKADLAALAVAALPAVATLGVAPASAAESCLARVWGEVLGVDAIGATDDLAAIGADSLAAVEASTLAASYGLDVPSALLAEHATVRAACRALGENAGAKSADWLRHAAGPAPSRAIAALPGEERRVLVTGATGHIGREVVRELLARRPGIAVVRLVRDANASAEPGVVDVHGDLAAPRLGLTARAWADLAESIDAIYHLGADVNLVAPFATLAPTNLGGTREVLALACEGRPKWVHHASTTAVLLAADAPPAVPLDETNELTSTRAVRGGYAQSKWAAEALLRDAEGVAITIHRFGLVPGAARDVLALVVRAALASRCLPSDTADSADGFDLVPVALAARAMTTLARTAAPGAGPATFHITGPRPIRFAELARALADAGAPVARVPLAEWRQRTAGAAHLPLLERRVDGRRTRALLGALAPSEEACLDTLRAIVHSCIAEVSA